MLIDARQLENGTQIQADVCIIGGGVAGITLALELDQLGIRTCLLESGGLEPDDATRDLYRGESVEIPYKFADGCRSRFLGGSSNCWGGWCAPLDPLDFERRDWIPNSGWPLAYTDLERYYQRAQGILQLGPYNYDPQYWESAIGRADVKRIPLPSGRVRDVISQFSPPARLGKLYGPRLRSSSCVTVYLHANATNIQAERLGAKIEHVDVATLTGRRHKATARLFVLATGGIENARLLLASNGVQPAGLANTYDLVGRYFMDHPRLVSGRVEFTESWARNKLFDIKFHYQNPYIAANGTAISAQFALSPDTQRQEGVTNARAWFFSTFAGEGSAAASALISVRRRVEGKHSPDSSLPREMLTLARHPVDTGCYVLAHFFKPQFLKNATRFQAIVEPEPDPASRVTLGTDKDALGMNRVRVGWRLGNLTRRTFDRNFAVLAQELQSAGIARVTLDPPLEGSADWPTTLDPEGTWHHMGTTRMHDSPRSGVVDRNCRVHGINNLFIAGSSVFPTGGANFPTASIVALTLRLAAHLSAQLTPTAAETTNAVLRSA
jgi:choline dehydrogenase-like flavoprotein